ncbi:MAG: hypothetical protein LBB08_00805 [Rickettsiales bacterium]|jgi:hypothetical protein|nr:hypothetical protein [Rickettsiales bacterium]
MKKIWISFFAMPCAAFAECSTSDYIVADAGEACPAGYKKIGTVKDACPSETKEFGTITNFSFSYSDNNGVGSCSVKEKPRLKSFYRGLVDNVLVIKAAILVFEVCDFHQSARRFNLRLRLLFVFLLVGPAAFIGHFRINARGLCMLFNGGYAPHCLDVIRQCTFGLAASVSQ